MEQNDQYFDIIARGLEIERSRQIRYDCITIMGKRNYKSVNRV
jgi:hypothetical protein